MKAVWTKTSEELVDIMVTRNVNDNSCCGVLLVLATEKKYKKMLRWVKKNPQAGQSEIIEHLDKICPPEVDSVTQKAPAVPCPAPRRAVRKIAAVL